uniref:efflux RND transporter periplasmic adaptor subunit n=1 Tax=Ningiella ruwaisensis TaxID=2364274 RepID=UPI00109F55B8|nr:efflux RND transporter periplasmic adaptor subunit [Ningiella ruwaisensis]
MTIRFLNALLLLFSTCLILGCAKPERDIKAVPVDWVKVKAANIQTTLSFPSVISPTQEVPISFDIGGRIVALNVDVGSTFEKGDVLAVLDDESQRMRVEEIQANIDSAVAVFKEASDTLERNAELVKAGAVSQAEYDAALRLQKTSAADIQRFNAQLTTARKALKDTQLIAPYGGSVVSKNADLAQVLQASSPVFEIQIKNKARELVIHVAERYINQIVLNDTVQVTLPAKDGITLYGEITRIGSQNSALTAYPVTVSLQDVDENIKNGMSAEVNLTLAQSNSSKLRAIPRSALVAGRANTHYVWVIDPETNTTSKRQVTLENIQSAQALISHGIEQGEMVVSKGANFIDEGIEVLPLSPSMLAFSE